MELDETTKQLFACWYQIGKENEDFLIRFFSFYLCLNVLMARLSEKETDREMICWVKRNGNILDKAYRLATRNHSFQKATKSLIDLCPVKAVGRQQNKELTMVDLNDFNSLVDVLYRIRCNLFHGKKNMMNERDKRLIETAIPILDGWMEHIQSLINQNSHNS